MRYFIRAAKYAVRLAVLLAIVWFVIGHSGMEAEGAAWWMTTRGLVFLAFVVLWVAVYPAIEYVRRQLFYTLGTHRKAITAALEAGGFELLRETETEMVFCSRSMLRRVMWLAEERVRVTALDDGGIEIEGPRRFVTEAVQRIPMYVEQN